MFGKSLWWRETHKPVRFLIFDGRIVAILLLTVMHPRWWTLFLAIVTIGVLTFFDRKGIGADSILRAIRSAIVGRKRSARGLADERSAVDFGYETQAMVDLEEFRIMSALKAKDARNAKSKAVGGRS
jgi:hypothetical protein